MYEYPVKHIKVCLTALFHKEIIMVKSSQFTGDPDPDQAVWLSYWQCHWEHFVEVSIEDLHLYKQYIWMF